MRRRALLSTLAGTSTVALAGCGMVPGRKTLWPATRGGESHDDGTIERYVTFDAGGSKLASFGGDATPHDGGIALTTSLWHRDGTRVQRFRLRLAMPSADGDRYGEVSMLAPFAGDVGEPPDVSLSFSRRPPGLVVAVDDLDDLADETINTRLRVFPPETATTLTVDCSIDLTGSGLLGRQFTLDSELRFEFEAPPTG